MGCGASYATANGEKIKMPPLAATDGGHTPRDEKMPPLEATDGDDAPRDDDDKVRRFLDISIYASIYVRRRSLSTVRWASQWRLVSVVWAACWKHG
eukprot:COSAG02_NODE_4122_length_5744_cov_18.406909_8_plen_96_part_00